MECHIVPAATLLGHPEFQAATHRRKAIVGAIKEAAAILGNTPAVCKRSYVHPLLLSRYEEGSLQGDLSRCQQIAARSPHRGLSRDEVRLLALLRAWAT